MSAEGTQFLSHCPHGVKAYMVCGQCQEQARREHLDEQYAQSFERLAAILEKLETRLGESA